MQNIQITPQNVRLAKLALGNFEGAFIHTFEVTAMNELYEAYVKKTQTQIPKAFIYIIMQQTFGAPTERDNNGNLGYRLRLK